VFEVSGKLESGLELLEVEPGGRKIDRLRRFVAELELWNPKYGLLANRDYVLIKVKQGVIISLCMRFLWMLLSQVSQQCREAE